MVDGLILLMATAPEFTGPVNLGNPEEISMSQLARRIVALTGSKSDFVRKPLPEDDPAQRRPDIGLARSALGWEPKISLDVGLARTIEYFSSPAPAHEKLSIVIPCYNEAETIRQIVEAVRSPYPDKEIIIVDDCSRDGTRDLLEPRSRRWSTGSSATRSTRARAPRSAPALPRPPATWSSCRTPTSNTTPGVPAAAPPILEGKADVVFGSRFMGAEAHRVLYFWHMRRQQASSRLLSNMFTNLNLTDMETCYKVFRREVLQKIAIEEDRFGFEPEITAKVARLRLPHLRGRHSAITAALTPRARRSAGATDSAPYIVS